MIPVAISEYLDRHHARYSLLTHPTAYTAQEEAAAAHVHGRKRAKTFADNQPILAVVPAPFAVDLNRLQQAGIRGGSCLNRKRKSRREPDTASDLASPARGRLLPGRPIP